MESPKKFSHKYIAVTNLMFSFSQLCNYLSSNFSSFDICVQFFYKDIKFNKNIVTDL